MRPFSSALIAALVSASAVRAADDSEVLAVLEPILPEEMLFLPRHP